MQANSTKPCIDAEYTIPTVKPVRHAFHHVNVSSELPVYLKALSINPSVFDYVHFFVT